MAFFRASQGGGKVTYKEIVMFSNDRSATVYKADGTIYTTSDYVSMSVSPSSYGSLTVSQNCHIEGLANCDLGRFRTHCDSDVVAGSYLLNGTAGSGVQELRIDYGYSNNDLTLLIS